MEGWYKEDDWIAKVEILEDNSTKDTERFKLKVIRTIRESKIYKPTPDGTIFDYLNTRGFYTGMFLELDD